MNKYKASLSKAFFSGGPVLYAGFSKRNEAYSMGIRDAFERAGIKVLPYNPRPDAEFSIPVYRSLDEIKPMPQVAFVATKAVRGAALVEELHERGVRRILFVSRMATTPELLARCEALGMVVAVGCPLMLFGSGFHRFHGWLSGVKAS